MTGDWQSILLILGFAAFLFFIYTLVPLTLVKGGAALLNLSLLTSDAFGVIFALFLFDAEVQSHFLTSLSTFVSSLSFSSSLWR